MRVVIQKCLNANVVINKKIYNEIKKGYVLLVSFCDTDTKTDIDYIIKKLLKLKLFDKKNIKEIEGEVLSISQFTLYADLKKGNYPSFTHVMNNQTASTLYDLFNEELGKELQVKTGIFGEDMQVNLTNDGPYTLILESKKGRE